MCTLCPVQWAKQAKYFPSLSNNLLLQDKCKYKNKIVNWIVRSINNIHTNYDCGSVLVHSLTCASSREGRRKAEEGGRGSNGIRNDLTRLASFQAKTTTDCQDHHSCVYKTVCLMVGEEPKVEKWAVHISNGGRKRKWQVYIALNKLGRNWLRHRASTYLAQSHKFKPHHRGKETVDTV